MDPRQSISGKLVIWAPNHPITVQSRNNFAFDGAKCPFTIAPLSWPSNEDLPWEDFWLNVRNLMSPKMLETLSFTGCILCPTCGSIFLPTALNWWKGERKAYLFHLDVMVWAKLVPTVFLSTWFPCTVCMFPRVMLSCTCGGTWVGSARQASIVNMGILDSGLYTGIYSLWPTVHDWYNKERDRKESWYYSIRKSEARCQSDLIPSVAVQSCNLEGNGRQLRETRKSQSSSSNGGLSVSSNTHGAVPASSNGAIPTSNNEQLDSTMVAVAQQPPCLDLSKLLPC
jgi:hypothetical protein